MPNRTVLLIWANPLFLESIQMLLRQSEVLCVAMTFDLPLVIEEIRKLHPEVIIFEKTENKASLDVTQIFGLTNLNMLVMELSLSDNELSVYQHHQLTIAKSEDLLNFVIG